jgi:hypothetical protein
MRTPPLPRFSGVHNIIGTSELRGEGGGFVEREMGFPILAPITQNLLEEAIYCAFTRKKVGIQRRGDAMEKPHGTHGDGSRGRGSGLPGRSHADPARKEQQEQGEAE